MDNPTLSEERLARIERLTLHSVRDVIVSADLRDLLAEVRRLRASPRLRRLPSRRPYVDLDTIPEPSAREGQGAEIPVVGFGWGVGGVEEPESGSNPKENA